MSRQTVKQYHQKIRDNTEPVGNRRWRCRKASPACRNIFLRSLQQSTLASDRSLPSGRSSLIRGPELLRRWRVINVEDASSGQSTEIPEAIRRSVRVYVGPDLEPGEADEPAPGHPVA